MSLSHGQIGVGKNVSIDLRPAAAIFGSQQSIKIPYKPRKQFEQVHNDPRRFKVIVAHRRFGKTVGSINGMNKNILTCNLPMPRGSYIAPTYTQAKEISWNYFKYYTNAIPGMQPLEGELKLKFPNRGEIKLWGADAIERLRGIYNDDLIVDEPGKMDIKFWPEILRPTLMDRKGKATFIGTPSGKDGFYDIYRIALKNPDEWGVYMFKASETGIIPQAELDDAKKFMSPDQYAREFECSFEVASDTQFISFEECQATLKRPRFGSGPVILGCDPARYGDDRTVIVVRNGDILETVWVAKGLSLMQTANQVSEFAKRYKPKLLCIDGCGLGAGLVDRLEAVGYGNVMDVNSGRVAGDKAHFGNAKGEMWSRMRNWIRDRAALEENKELFDDLTAVNYSFDRRDRMIIETKDDLRARGIPSPDLADALALTFAVQLAPQDMTGYARANTHQVIPTYNPLDDFV